MNTLKKMTFEELKNLPPLTEEEKQIIRTASEKARAGKIAEDPDCPKQTKEELAMYRPWYEVHPDFYKPRKKAIQIKLDCDVLEWFKSQGKGYQTRINAVLRKHAFGSNAFPQK